MNREVWKVGLSGISGTFKFDEKLSSHTYYRIGGPADLLISPSGASDLEKIYELLKKDPQPIFFLGLGSNLLVSDDGFRGVIIKTQKLCLDWDLVDGFISLGASLPITTVLRKAWELGVSGLEFLAGIPGSVGGTVFMNAGTTLGEVKDRIQSVDVFSFETGRMKTLELPLQYEYRKNLFLKQKDLVVRVKYQIEKGDPAFIKTTIQSLLDKRKQNQPVDMPSCGSVFKNPKPLHAWQVIDRLGLRGHRIGGAQISEKHTNYIVNLGNARATDVKTLIDIVKSRALAELGIQMEEEVRYLGFF